MVTVLQSINELYTRFDLKVTRIFLPKKYLFNAQCIPLPLQNSPPLILQCPFEFGNREKSQAAMS